MIKVIPYLERNKLFIHSFIQPLPDECRNHVARLEYRYGKRTSERANKNEKAKKERKKKKRKKKKRKKEKTFKIQPFTSSM